MDLAILLWPDGLATGNANSGERQVITRQSLLVATQNQGKLRELRQLLAHLPIELSALTDFPTVEKVPETGDSFIENASLKAVGYATQTGRLTVADDSGLEVDALGGAPGILSSRYAGEGASDADRIGKLLAELSRNSAAERSARFVSAGFSGRGRGKILHVSVGNCGGGVNFFGR